jgi:hypothetical protein
VAKGVREQGAVTLTEVIAVHKQSRFLLGVLENEADLLARADVDPLAAAELQGSIEAIENEIKIPTAKQMMVSSLTAGMGKELVLTLYHRAVRAMHAMAPIVAIKLAEKIDDHQAPGSTRVLIEMARGLGLFIPAEPIAAKNRMDMMDEGALEDRSTEDLRQEALKFS